ncbi:PilZ domain-containing protein [Paenibacillus sedimenti]|uniref:PilZ domain-containing protein n=1 Tax=Paenibacillus sedimenti TaxID=2770274 RepID=A0A926KUX4_9BACL|nr:PilZ domain-containing protein [Paenibacillus sedimenti]MBD0382445.1 PilZ domain-containing protein [Paenibacillus sedimenti]
MSFNQRESFRINLQIPLSAMFKIIGIQNEATDTKYTKISIKDISSGGIRIHTPLDLPVNMSLLLEFTFTLFSQDVKVLGTITRKSMLHASLYEYGIKFSIADIQLEQQLRSHLHMLSTRLRHTNVLSSCSFCSEEEMVEIYSHDSDAT